MDPEIVATRRVYQEACRTAAYRIGDEEAMSLPQTHTWQGIAVSLLKHLEDGQSEILGVNQLGCQCLIYMEDLLPDDEGVFTVDTAELVALPAAFASEAQRAGRFLS